MAQSLGRIMKALERQEDRELIAAEKLLEASQPAAKPKRKRAPRAPMKLADLVDEGELRRATEDAPLFPPRARESEAAHSGIGEDEPVAPPLEGAGPR